jgi:hypothetical protein
MIRAAIGAARSNRARGLLADTTGLTRFTSPDTIQRYRAVETWARGAVRLAIVAQAEMIDPQRFGGTVAQNRDLVGDIFTTEEEARVWLDGPPSRAPV